MRLASTLFSAVLMAHVTIAAPLRLSLLSPAPAEAGYFKMGTARSSSRHVLTLDSRSLRLDGEPWLPAMGEFHYSRYPAAEWREELLKMKAGGIDIVASYVFWIHHEEVPGEWNWSHERDLRRFVETAGEVGLHVVVRLGPWCHGEVRNGGLPDWVIDGSHGKPRSTDRAFLAPVKALYAQIARQLTGLLWKEGGPVIGVQLDNEYGGPAEYLVELKKIAREVGLDVPLYTRTGWPALQTPMPLGEIVPLYGVYAEGFWDREITSMPGKYWQGFHFSALRTDAAIATEMLGNRDAKDEPDVARYPYLTCEIGGGMMSSYHRRILVDPRDIETTTLIKIAGGSTLPGYYMYHGGTNPDGRTPLMEAQDTPLTNYNDLPVKTYDFQAPLGEYGEVRPHYHRLRRLHLFLREHGSDLTSMVPTLPEARPAGRDDVTTLRWAARSDGRRGFVFLSNYERSRELPSKRDVQFELALANGDRVVFPTKPVTIPPGVVAWWPFNINLGGLTLLSATAQPVTHAVEGNGSRTLFFAATPGVAAEFVFPEDQVARLESTGTVVRSGGRIVVSDLVPGRAAAIRILTVNDGRIHIVLLDDADSLALWKGPFGGRQRVLLSSFPLVFDGGAVRVTAVDGAEKGLAVFPRPAALESAAGRDGGRPDGVFQRYDVRPALRRTALQVEQLRPAGASRVVPRGPAKHGVAMAPKDADFPAAGAWRIRIPATADAGWFPIVRVTYRGDVARARIGGRLVTDDFYNGLPKNIGIWRTLPDARRNGVVFEVLPVPVDAPVFFPAGVLPDLARGQRAELIHAELVETETLSIAALPAAEPALPENFRTDVALPPTRGNFR